MCDGRIRVVIKWLVRKGIAETLIQTAFSSGRGEVNLRRSWQCVRPHSLQIHQKHAGPFVVLVQVPWKSEGKLKCNNSGHLLGAVRAKNSANILARVDRGISYLGWLSPSVPNIKFQRSVLKGGGVHGQNSSGNSATNPLKRVLHSRDNRLAREESGNGISPLYVYLTFESKVAG
jgi:hypothetical protein